ncbi:MAG: hypothetical protein Q4G43_08920 [Mobilicoccus sp.]|nr:hypothetical protein [Mobilicoccus sp.]
MSLDFDHIPAADDAPEGAPRSEALSGLGALARRRTVLRGMALAATTVGATALGWSPLGGGLAARAETSPSGLQGWDRNDCRDAYPNGYTARPDTEGAFRDRAGACFGGYRMGSTLCDSSGWHRADVERRSFLESWAYRPISTACGATTTKNAWRWTVDGVTYRCSDGTMSVRFLGISWFTYLTICRSVV